MAFQTPITIRKVVEEIHNRKYLLPAIQRELVWEIDQIERLFDSLMRDYPIGSFLFWQVHKTKIKDYQFYEFLREYHERDNKHNPKANVSGEEDITAILDGQQRLTALYIGLKGTYSYKLPRKSWDNNAAFPKRELYLNLLSNADNPDLKYDFQFLTDEEAIQKDTGTFWFKTGKMLDFDPDKPNELYNYLVDNGLSQNKFAGECLFKLSQVINKSATINYYLEESEVLDKVLNIFIRVNSGGTQLSYSDLLLSIATAQWEEKDARQEIISIVDDINNTGDGFDFDKDLILKTCLAVTDIKDIAFKVDNFSVANMRKIEEAWDNITQAIKLAVSLIDSFGYQRNTLVSNYVIIPIAYYLYKIGNPQNFALSSKYTEDRKKIANFVSKALLKKIFGGVPDTLLKSIREVMQNTDLSFPYQAIIEKLRGTTKSLIFTDDEIENLLYYKYGQRYTFSVLTFLYPNFDFRRKFHQDHIFPKDFFKRRKLRKKGIPSEKHDYYISNYNYIGNLQLLEGIPNQEKSNMDFKQWLDTTYPEKQTRNLFIETHFIPNVDFDFANFETFYERRKELILNKLKSLLIP